MKYKAAIFDMDGVLYHDMDAIPGAVQTVNSLRKQGMKIYFLTNNAGRSRKSFVEKLKALGFEANEGEVESSAYASARYIKKHKPNAKVYVFGSQGLKGEIRMAGLSVADEKDYSAQVLVNGFDRNFNFEKLSDALQVILNGAFWVSANPDTSYPGKGGKILPGAGAMAAALCAASGRKPDVVVGKPSIHIIEPILETLECKRQEVILVGDRLDTDIALANKAGFDSALVLTGISSKADVENAACKFRPTYVLNSIADLPKVLVGK